MYNNNIVIPRDKQAVSKPKNGTAENFEAPSQQSSLVIIEKKMEKLASTCDVSTLTIKPRIVSLGRKNHGKKCRDVIL